MIGRTRDEVLGAAPPLPWWTDEQRAWLAAQVGENWEHAAGRGRYAFLDMIGYSRDDLEQGGIDWPALTPPEWRATDAAAGVTAFRTGVSGPLEKQYVHRDGGRVWVRIAGAVVEWEPYRWINFVEDVNDRHRAEDALAAAEAQRDELLQELADTNAQLQTALDARVVVEQAKGQ